MTAPLPGLTAKAKIIHVVDGDTVDLELRIDARIRLLDCYAPESRTTDPEEKKKGLAAKANMELLCQGETGIVHIPFTHAQSLADVLTLDRILGKVWMDNSDTDLSSQQVSDGYASSTKNGNLGE